MDVPARGAKHQRVLGRDGRRGVLVIDAQLARGLTPAGRRTVVAAQAVAVAALVSYAASLLLRGPGHPSVLWDAVVGNGVIVGGAVLCALRGALVAEQRAAWWSLAVGLLAYVAGGIHWWMRLSSFDDPPYPSWTDAGYLALYPTAYVALLLLVRSSVVRLQPSVWLDGLVGGLSAAAPRCSSTRS